MRVSGPIATTVLVLLQIVSPDRWGITELLAQPLLQGISTCHEGAATKHVEPRLGQDLVSGYGIKTRPTINII